MRRKLKQRFSAVVLSTCLGVAGLSLFSIIDKAQQEEQLQSAASQMGHSMVPFIQNGKVPN